MTESKVKRVGIVTGGGDCPGLNAVIRAVAKAAMGECGASVVGIQDGFETAEPPQQRFGRLLYVPARNAQRQQKFDDFVLGKPGKTGLLETLPQTVTMSRA